MKNQSIFTIAVILVCILPVLLSCNNYNRYASYEPVYYKNSARFEKFNKVVRPSKIIGTDLKHTFFGKDVNLLQFMDSINFLSHTQDTIYYISRICQPDFKRFEMYLNQQKVFIEDSVGQNDNVKFYKVVPVNPSRFDNETLRNFAIDDSIMVDWITAWDIQKLQHALHNRRPVDDGCLLSVDRYIISNDTIVEQEACYFDEPLFWRFYGRSK